MVLLGLSSNLGSEGGDKDRLVVYPRLTSDYGRGVVNPLCSIPMEQFISCERAVVQVISKTLAARVG